MCFFFQCVHMNPLTCNSKPSVSAGLYSHSWSIQNQSSDPQAQRPCVHGVNDTFVLASWLNADLPARRGRDHAPTSCSSTVWMAAETHNHHTDAVTAMLRHALIQWDDSNMQSEKHRFLHHFLLPLRPSSNPTWRSTLSVGVLFSDGSSNVRWK